MLDKIRSLSKDTLIYGTSTMVSRFLNFILVPFYTNFISPADYGIVANVFAYIAILNVFFSIGLESGYFKFASTLEVGNKKENFSLPFGAVFLNSLILSCIIFFFPGLFKGIFGVGESMLTLVKYTALILFLDAVALVPFAYLRLNHKAKVFAGIKIVNVVVNVGMNLILIVHYGMGIEAIFISNVVASAVTLLLLLPIVLKNFIFSFHGKLFSELLRFSIPYIPAGISANLIQVIDRPILLYLKGEEVVGIYNANYKLGIVMMILVSVFEFAWRPFFLNNAKEPNAKKIFAKVMTLFVSVACFLWLMTSVFLPEIILIFGEAYRSGLYIVPVVLLAYVFYGIYINLMPGIYIEKKTKHLPWITGTAALLNVGVNLILIPELGIMGAAIATLVSYISMMTGIYIVAQKYYKISYEYWKLVFIFAAMFASYGVYLLFGTGLDGMWYLKAVLGVVFILLILVFKVFDYKSVKRIITGGKM